MNKKFINRIYSIIKEETTINGFLIRKHQLLDNQQADVFEIQTYLGLKVHPVYGPEVYWPNELYGTGLVEKYNLDTILAGAGTMGGDMFSIGSIKKKLIAVESKSEYKNKKKKKSLSSQAIGNKEGPLNKTKIDKKDRICVYDFDSVSWKAEKIYNHWTYIHIDELFNEETYEQIRDYVLKDRLPEQTPFGYRDDVLKSNYHEKQIDRIFDKIKNQIKKWGKSKGLVIKPTASGKGTDPLLLYREKFLPYWKSKGIKKPLTVTVNPSLNVLTGNVLKQVRDHIGSGLNVKTIVYASDLTPGDDPNDLNILETQVEVVHSDKELQDLIDNTKSNIWIHTTIHSYNPINGGGVAEALYSTGIKKIELMFIDEVKHSVQDWDSSWVNCLKDKPLKVINRIGLDANIVDGKDDDGKEYISSMRNTKTWREIYDNMPEAMAVKLGWKRHTKIKVLRFLDNNLPMALRDSMYEGKNGFVKFKGTNVTIPMTWVTSIWSIVLGRFHNPSLHHTMATTNKIKWANEYETAFRKLLPLILKSLPKNKNTSTIIKRLSKMKVVSIYNLGKSSKAIQRKVDGIPRKNKDSVIIQVKLLTEGWDPKDAWLDSWTFADPTGSKIRIYQAGGRPARIGDDIYNPRQKDSVCFLPLIVQSDLTKEVSINRAFKQLARVAEAMELGKDSIDDSIEFYDYQNITTTRSTRTKNSRNRKALLEMTANQMTNAFGGYYRSNSRYSPFNELADKLCRELQAYYKMPRHTGRTIEAFYKPFLKNKEWHPFFKQYSPVKHSTNKKSKPSYASLLGGVRKGLNWHLSDDVRLEAKKNYRTHIKGRSLVYENRIRNIVAVIKKLVVKIDQEHLSFNKGTTYGFYANIAKDPLINVDGNYKATRNGVSKTFKNKRSTLSNYDIELDRKIIAEGQQMIDDYWKRVQQLRKKIRDDILIEAKKEMNPTITKTQGDIYLRVAKKYNLNIGKKKENYTVRKISRDFKLEKKYAIMKKKNDKLAVKLYLKNAKSFVDSGKTVLGLDKYVQKELKKKGIKTGLFTLVENVRKKNSKIMFFNKLFQKNKMIYVNKIRKSNGNPAWNAGRKGPPSPIKGKTMSQVSYLRKGVLARKKTMAKRYPNGFPAWNKGLTIKNGDLKKSGGRKIA